jgi:hypothetical protein
MASMIIGGGLDLVRDDTDIDHLLQQLVLLLGMECAQAVERTFGNRRMKNQVRGEFGVQKAARRQGDPVSLKP